MKLWDLFSEDALQGQIAAKLVTCKTHPEYPDLRLLNYTEKAQVKDAWNVVTLASRGLIYNALTGDILARPFGKFFNLSERRSSCALDDTAIITDKKDGSLGILFFTADGLPHIATRGSFAGPQAAHATRLYREKYHDKWTVDRAKTYLFEIIYPENRIVLDYGDLDDLVLLARVAIGTGTVEFTMDTDWPGCRTELFKHNTLASFLDCAEDCNRPNAEGVVVFFPHTNTMVKIKQDSYKTLHKNKVRLTPASVCDALARGSTADDICMTIPDEFHAWTRETAARLRADFEKRSEDLLVLFHSIEAKDERKAFAQQAGKYPDRMRYLFALSNGKNIAPMVWAAVRSDCAAT